MARVKKEFTGKSRTVTDPTVFTPQRAASYTQRGEFVPSSGRVPLPPGDYSNFPKNLASALTIVKEANERFMALPAKVRQRFGNNPGELSSFISQAVSNPEFKEEAIKLGLMKAPEKPKPPAGSSGAGAPPEGDPPSE